MKTQRDVTFRLAKGPGQEVGPPGQGDSPVDVHQPGGELLNQLLHPSITVFDQLFRIQPDDAWYAASVNAANPVQFEVGSFRVPAGVHLWIQNYEFSIYRQSGVDSGDFLRCEDDRFSGTMGFDLTINNTRPASLRMQLDPLPVATSRGGFNCAQNTNNAVSQAPYYVSKLAAGFGVDLVSSGCSGTPSTSSAATSSQGLSLLPARSARQGAPAPNPFTFVAKENALVSLSCVIFRTVRTPLAFVQAELQGYLWQSNASEAIINRMRPR